MSPLAVKAWTLQAWSEFIGEDNRPAVERLQKSAILRAPPPPLLVIAPYGAGKTALADLLIKSHACPNITPSGDPCHACRDCQLDFPACNGMGSRYRRFEVDCHRARLGRDELNDLLDDIVQEDDVAVFFDELHGLDRICLNLLLTKLPKCPGIVIAAIKDSEFRTLPAELYERFRKIWLQTPSADEMVTFFCSKAKSLGVQTDAETVRLMVDRTDRSFRTCLDILQAAMDDSPGVLDRSLLQEFFAVARIY